MSHCLTIKKVFWKITRI